MQIELEQFAGPLDLLLSLIEEEKLDISAISLARIADQYVAYVVAHPETPLETLIHFLEIGSRLVVLKARLLIFHLTEYEEDDADLVEHLRHYREYRAAVRCLHALWIKKEKVMYSAAIGERFRATAAREEETSISIRAVHAAMRRVAKRLARIPAPHAVIGRRTFNIHERISAIQTYLSTAKRALFSELTENRQKHDIIVNFLALLELVKCGAIRIRQEVMWGEIVVEQFYATSNSH